MLRNIVFLFPPEFAHKMAIFALKHGLMRPKCPKSNSILNNKVFGKEFASPVGLAAGFDKNGDCINALLDNVFSFVEVGTITLRSQVGNQKPRIFRLVQDSAVINCLGFNNKGVDYLINNLNSVHNKKGLIGVNVGRNKDSANDSSDYLKLLKLVYGLADYITLNISSPNTDSLRDLQSPELLENLLGDLVRAKSSLKQSCGRAVPLLVKIAPDLQDSVIENIASIALKYRIDGLILTNTTIQRDKDLKGEFKMKKGGLSGQPLFELSTRILQDFYLVTKGNIPLIGCGGVSNAKQVYEKIKKGASLVQLYTGLIYNGFDAVADINRDLASYLHRDGFNSINEAIGCEV